jgi:cytochrome c oxidase subunit II
MRLKEWIAGATVLWCFPLFACAAADGPRELDSALRATPDLANGAKIYLTCAACHGSSGVGVADGSVPAVGGQHFRVLVRELVDYRHDKRWDPRMAQFSAKRHIPDAQSVADVAAYISGLDAAWVSAPSGADTAHGKELYVRACASCHGLEAGGNGADGYPRLRGQHNEYLVRQMHDVLEERRSNLSRKHVRLLEPLDKADILGVAAYLSNLR